MWGTGPPILRLSCSRRTEDTLESRNPSSEPEIEMPHFLRSILSRVAVDRKRHQPRQMRRRPGVHSEQGPSSERRENFLAPVPGCRVGSIFIVPVGATGGVLFPVLVQRSKWRCLFEYVQPFSPLSVLVTNRIQVFRIRVILLISPELEVGFQPTLDYLPR